MCGVSNNHATYTDVGGIACFLGDFGFCFGEGSGV